MAKDKKLRTVKTVSVKVPSLTGKPAESANDSKMQHFESSVRNDVAVPVHYRLGQAIGRRETGKPLFLNRRFFGIDENDLGRTIVAQVVVNEETRDSGTFVSVDAKKYKKWQQPTTRLVIVQEKRAEDDIAIAGSNGWYIHFEPLTEQAA